MIHATMGTSLQNDMNTLITESSCLKIQPTSRNESDNANKTAPTPPPPPSSSSSDLTPSSLSFPSLKYEPLDQGDMEIQSPETNSLWESFFTEQLETDFMISSPVRTSLPSSSQSSNFNYYPSSSLNNGHAAFGCSPPRTASPLGPFNNNNNNNKPKGMSPLQRVFSNSPNNQFMQVETISLPALENFLDDFDGDDEFLAYSTTGVAAVSSSDQSYDSLTTIPALLDCLTLPSPSRFYGEANQTVLSGGGVGGSADNDMYQHMRPAPPSDVPLMEQLEQERREEKQHRQQQQQQQLQQQQQQQLQQQPRQQLPSSRLQRQQQPMNHNHNHLMVPPPIGPEVCFFLYVSLYTYTC